MKETFVAKEMTQQDWIALRKAAQVHEWPIGKIANEAGQVTSANTEDDYE